MSETFLISTATAFWLGILTSISPCPLATNIAAISYIGKNLENGGRVLISGISYTIGRTITYTFLGIILVASVLSTPSVSFALQKYMDIILGPILIIVGMFLLELLKINLPSANVGESVQKKLSGGGIAGSLLLGIIFALSFCPVSAALFFGSLVPISIKYNSSVFLPALYGIGTSLPVFGFALLVAFGAKSIGKHFQKLTQFELWARRLTGIIFISVGVYFIITNIFIG